MINQLVLVGRLTRDPELRYTQSGIAVARFTLACDRPFTGQDGKKEVDFIDCVVWRKQAENVTQYLKKGSMAGLTGRLQISSYDDKDGNRKYRAEAVADSVRFLDSKKDSEPSAPRSKAPVKQDKPASGFGADPFSSGSSIDLSDDDLPF